MEELLAYGSLDANPRWGCSKINLTYNELRMRHEPKIVLGLLYIFLGLFFQVCYILALSVICTREFLQLSCYKIMMCLGILDLVCTTFSSEISGFFYLIGAEYCMYPMLQYLSGCMIVGCFATICGLSLLLVMNRLIDFWQPRFATALFKGSKTWFYIIVCFCYGFYALVKAPSVVFNVDYGAWIYHPLIPGKMELEYTSPFQTVNNIVTSSGMCTAYVAICILHAYKLRGTKVVRRSNLQRKILIQALCVCFFTLTTTTLWASMLFYTPSVFIMHLGQASWHLMHGVPSLVYLFLNKTIQRRVFGRLAKLAYAPSTGIKPATSMGAEARSQQKPPSTSVQLEF